MSHLKNVQAFGKLTGICTGYGGQYNPGQQNLQVNAMTTLMLKAQQAMEAWIEAEAFYDQATNKRKAEFTELQRVSSGVCSILRASGASELTVSDGYSFNRLIGGSGRRKRNAASPAMTNAAADQAPPPVISRSSAAFASKANSFAKLVELVTMEPKYTPNEYSFTAAGLQQKLTEMQALNALVAQAEIRLTQARRDRDDLFYQMQGNLFSTATAAKQYIRGVFGYRSSQHLEVQKLLFTNPRS